MFKVYYKFTFVLLFLAISHVLFSQNTNVGINTAGTTPSINAILDLNSGNNYNLGLIIPHVTLGGTATQFSLPIVNPPTTKDTGLMVYNMNGPQPVGYYYWNGTFWVAVAGAGGGGNVNACGGAITNYIPYYTSPTVICNSSLYQLTPTTVGIGTITPQNMLDINGGMAVGTYAGNNTAPANGVIASGQVGIGTNTPNAAALLDLTSNSMGVLTPRLTATQIAAIASPAVGLIVYNTSTNCFEFNATGAPGGWNDLACACSAVPSTPGPISPVNACFGVVNQVISVPIDFGATYYTWTVPAMVSSWSGQGTNAITVSSYASTGTGNFTVTASNACGNSTTTTLSFTVFTGNPTGSLSIGSTNICSSSGTTVTIPGLGNYATIVWNAPSTICSPAVLTAANASNATSLTLSGGTGGTGVVSVTISNPCGSISSSTATITCYPGVPTGVLNSASTTYCSANTDVVTIFGAGNYATITWSAPTTICTNAALLAAANTTTLNMTGGTGGIGTVSATITNTCGSITPTTASITCSNGLPTGSLSATSSFCYPSTPNDAVTIPGLGNYFTIVWSAPTTICSAAVVAAANAANGGNGATSLTLSGGTGGTGTVTATITNACGSIIPTTGTITYTVPTITLDASAQGGAGVTSFNITTTQANDLVIVSCNGEGTLTAPTPVAITGAGTPTVNFYKNINANANDASVYIYWFVAATPGIYTITVTETGMTAPNYYNFAAALTGFCNTPSAVDFINFNTGTQSCPSGCSSVSQLLTENAGSYAFGSFANDYYLLFGGVGWSNLSLLQNTGPGAGIDECSIAGQSIGVSGTPSITANDFNITYAALMLIDIQ